MDLGFQFNMSRNILRGGLPYGEVRRLPWGIKKRLSDLLSGRTLKGIILSGLPGGESLSGSDSALTMSVNRKWPAFT